MHQATFFLLDHLLRGSNWRKYISVLRCTTTATRFVDLAAVDARPVDRRTPAARHAHHDDRLRRGAFLGRSAPGRRRGSRDRSPAGTPRSTAAASSTSDSQRQGPYRRPARRQARGGCGQSRSAGVMSAMDIIHTVPLFLLAGSAGPAAACLMLYVHLRSCRHCAQCLVGSRDGRPTPWYGHGIFAIAFIAMAVAYDDRGHPTSLLSFFCRRSYRFFDRHDSRDHQTTSAVLSPGSLSDNRSRGSRLRGTLLRADRSFDCISDLPYARWSRQSACHRQLLNPQAEGELASEISPERLAEQRASDFRLFIALHCPFTRSIAMFCDGAPASTAGARPGRSESPGRKVKKRNRFSGWGFTRRRKAAKAQKRISNLKSQISNLQISDFKSAAPCLFLNASSSPLPAAGLPISFAGDDRKILLLRLWPLRENSCVSIRFCS